MRDARIIVTGNVAALPVLRNTRNGDRWVTFRIAHTPRKKDAEGNWYDQDTIWFSVSQFRTAAENAAQSLKVGDRVVVTGRLTLRTWTSDQGVKGEGLEIDAENVGLDLGRHPATVVKPAPLMASVDPGPGDPPGDDLGEEIERFTQQQQVTV